MRHDGEFTLRLAAFADIPVLQALIQASVFGLQSNDYTSAQLHAALDSVYGIDTRLIEDGTYFVVEAHGEIVACGGWSRRKTMYGADTWTERDDAYLDATRDAAKIRAFFVHPKWSRRGIGSAILHASEEAAAAYGFTRFEMGATLTGVPLYEKHGYTARKRIELELPRGETLPIVHMTKETPSAN